MLLVQVRDYLRVAAAEKSVTASFELVAYLEVVVELAVLDTPDRAVLVRDRLVSTLHIHNREPTNPEGDPRLLIRAAVVWAAVPQDVGHHVETARLENPPGHPADLDHTANAAHATKRYGSSPVEIDARSARLGTSDLAY